MAKPARTTAQRGYGTAHQKERQRWAPVVAAGNAQCSERICLHHTRHITPGSAWDLAHNDDRTAVKGVSHARCNRSDGARRGNAMRKVTTPIRFRQSRAWL